MRLEGRPGVKGRQPLSKRVFPAALIVIAVLGLVTCSNKSDSGDGSSSSTSKPIGTTEFFGVRPTTTTSTTTLLGPRVPGRVPGSGQVITVLARSELKKTARQMAADFNQASPGYQVLLTLANGPDTGTLLRSGKKFDIVLENRKHMDSFSEENLVIWSPLAFANQVPVIVVAPGNPKGVRDLSSFGVDPTSVSGVCTPLRNCGRVALILFNRSLIRPAPDVTLLRARAVIAAIQKGEIDVSILDGVKAASHPLSVEAISISSTVNVTAARWNLSSATDSTGAGAFSDFIFSGAGSAILAKYGLYPPAL